MTANRRLVSFKTRSRLYAAGGVCFMLAGIVNFFAMSHEHANWLMVFGFEVLGAFYLFIAYVYKTKGEPLEQTRERDGDR